jgi:lipoate-protein ligase A
MSRRDSFIGVVFIEFSGGVNFFNYFLFLTADYEQALNEKTSPLTAPDGIFNPMSSSVRILVHPAQNRYLNMAVDEALLRLCRQPILRFYRWSEPSATSIGYFQAYTDAPDNRPFVRRYTGGGLVDHAADFTYSVILPREHPLNLAGTSKSYHQIHGAVAKGLQREGLEVRLAPANDQVESTACFQKAVRYDVITGITNKEKIAGAAQRRTREGCLHQGSILLKSFDFKSLSCSIGEYMISLMGANAEESELTPEETTKARTLETGRYATKQWNYSK